MSVPILTFFNNKGGVGKTSLIYHLSWMFSNIGRRVVAMDADPQANLTASFLDDDRLEEIWNDTGNPRTIYSCLKPLGGMGDLREPIPTRVTETLSLIPGDVALAGFEESLSDEWPRSMGNSNLERPFRILSAFWHIAQSAAKETNADIILMDVGPNLGAINRSALIASDYIIIPLGADIFSLQGLRNLGPTLRSWRSLWRKRLENWQNPVFELPLGSMTPIGYLIQQHGIRLTRPVKAYDRWIKRIPNMYRNYITEEPETDIGPEKDSYCLATIKHFRSLVPMAQEARKPIFSLTSADGAIGSHASAVHDAYIDFQTLAQTISQKIKLHTNRS